MTESASPLRFALSEVKEEGEMTVRATAPATLFDGVLSEGALISPLTVDGTIRRVDDDALFDGSVQGRWQFECTRCLIPIEQVWKEPLQSSAPIDLGSMDLTEDTRQAIALAQPMKIVCKPECLGLCPVCRANRNAADCGHRTPDLPDGSHSTRPRLTPRPHKG